MARRKPVWLQKREYDLAKAREAYYATKTPSTLTTVRKRKTDTLVYASYSIRAAGTSALYKVPVTQASLTLFGGAAALGLKTIASVVDPVSAAPRNFTPAKVHAMKADATPTAKVTPWGSRVIRYNTPTTGDAQAFFSAPISSGDNTATYDEIDAKATTVFNAIKASLGDQDYARFYVTPEKFSNSKI